MTYGQLEALLNKIDKYEKFLNEIREYCINKIKICDETYLSNEYNWNEDFIREILTRKLVYQEILDKVDDL